MRKILIGFCLLLKINLIHAQDWPVGTTWIYEQYEFLWPPDPYNYIIFKISGDTLIQNQQAKILVGFGWNSSKDSTQIKPPLDTYFIKTGNGKIHLWNLDSSRFELIYDFNVRPMDSLSYYIGPFKSSRDTIEYTKYVVESEKEVETSNGFKKIKYLQELKMDKHCIIYNGGIIDEIGCIAYFFQHYCLWDPGIGGNLVCFTNGVFNYPKDYTCKIPTGIQNPLEFPPVIYPNPTNDIITIQNFPNLESRVMLYNSLGQPFVCKGDENRIETSTLPAGVYLLELNNGTMHYSYKLIRL